MTFSEHALELCVLPSVHVSVAAVVKYIANIFIHMPIIAWLPTSKRCLGKRLPPGGTLLFERSVHFSIGAD